MRVVGFLPFVAAAAAALVQVTPAVAAPPEAAVTREDLAAANYRQGMVAFQQRCSACHSVADGGLDLAGPNLFGVFARRAAARPAFKYSEALRRADFAWTPGRLLAWLGDPAGYLPGNAMAMPEAVPAADRVALVSFLMLETGAADWPRPRPPAAASAAAADRSRPLPERFPSFWNHLMTNTTRYHLVSGASDLRFDAYFETDGSVRASSPDIRGFWHADERDMFCYALYGLPGEPRQLVECFPIVAMSIPRFREELWTSEPQPGVRLTGGIVAGRPGRAPHQRDGR